MILLLLGVSVRWTKPLNPSVDESPENRLIIYSLWVEKPHHNLLQQQTKDLEHRRNSRELDESSESSRAHGSRVKSCLIGPRICDRSLLGLLRAKSPYLDFSISILELFPESGQPVKSTRVGTTAARRNEYFVLIINHKVYHDLLLCAYFGFRVIGCGLNVSMLISHGHGSSFITLTPPSASSSAMYRKLYPLFDSLVLLWRYGLSLLRMNRFVKDMLQRFMLYYSDLESRPVFETLEEMLKWSGLYGLTRCTLQEELADAGISSRLTSELITVITRINYGQDVTISGLAGAVSLAGSDPGLWSVSGGNWQLAAGLIRHSNATLHLDEGINSITNVGGYYELNSSKGNSYACEVTVIATPLDEINITIVPPVSIPSRRLQHTYTTFVRGLLNPKYFGLNIASEIPDLVGTLELPDIPFSSISILKKYNEEDISYKLFSRAPLDDDFLDILFSKRRETLRINWPAYPHYEAPELFAPIILDGAHLYYINSFESAASTIETSAVAAENVARLIIARISGQLSSFAPILRSHSTEESLHTDL
ncbi:hypothetical protein ZIOFF_035689 [Zingiber officinale]|uniref:Prenylcysteine lyase domain-containing protein n=1 Tax=Zingiber officinale TaxID=94328 RepID=A0A8J5GHI8_ZINOF|nr:hypothetical protein ZIOFF_035689 [Zingiber officinale]